MAFAGPRLTVMMLILPRIYLPGFDGLISRSRSAVLPCCRTYLDRDLILVELHIRGGESRGENEWDTSRRIPRASEARWSPDPPQSTMHPEVQVHAYSQPIAFSLRIRLRFLPKSEGELPVLPVNSILSFSSL